MIHSSKIYKYEKKSCDITKHAPFSFLLLSTVCLLVKLNHSESVCAICILSPHCHVPTSLHQEYLPQGEMEKVVTML